ALAELDGDAAARLLDPRRLEERLELRRGRGAHGVPGEGPAAAGGVGLRVTRQRRRRRRLVALARRVSRGRVLARRGGGSRTRVAGASRRGRGRRGRVGGG